MRYVCKIYEDGTLYAYSTSDDGGTLLTEFEGKKPENGARLSAFAEISFDNDDIGKVRVTKALAKLQNFFNQESQVGKYRVDSLGDQPAEIESAVQNMISKTVNLIAQEYQPKKIVLFGSYAYGTPDAESDIDLLIIKETDTPFFQRLFEVQRLVSDVRRGYAFDPIVLSPREVKERLRRGDQFIKEILQKGVVMYDQQSG
jgi:uncharacterized protein